MKIPNCEDLPGCVVKGAVGRPIGSAACSPGCSACDK